MLQSFDLVIVIKIITNQIERIKKNEWLGSCINGQSPLEEKVPWEQFFFYFDFYFKVLLLFKEKKRE